MDGGEGADGAAASAEAMSQQEATEEFDLSDILSEDVGGGASKQDRLEEIEAQQQESHQ